MGTFNGETCSEGVWSGATCNERVPSERTWSEVNVGVLGRGGSSGRVKGVRTPP